MNDLLRYLRGTEDLGLLYTKGETTEIIGYAHAGFKTDDFWKVPNRIHIFEE